MGTPGWLELQDMVNVRDLGGLPTRDGRTTLPGRLLRGETPDLVDPADVEHLVDVVGLGLVVDLRMSTEQRGRRSPLAEAGVEVLPFPMYDDPLTSARLKVPVPDGEGPRVMAEHYLRVLASFRERAVVLLERLVDRPAPTLVHCAGGKDRTGMVVAVLLGAAGVDRGAIVADYAATELRLDRLFARLTRVFGTEHPPPGLPPHTLRAPARTMEVVLDDLADPDGGLTGWWLDGGADRTTLVAWREQLIGAS
jgi:hypothetical protein